MRKVILVIIGVLFLATSLFLAYSLVTAPEEPKQSKSDNYKPVTVEKVINKDIPIKVNTNGVAEAIRKFELFSEVEGVFQYSSKDFRPGQKYSKGQVLLKMNNDEFRANVISAKSEFFNLLVSIMPDLKIDYPDEFSEWQAYLNGFDVKKSLKTMPEASRQLEYFITGRGLMSSYYNIKNLESRLNKFVIRAPFDGVLTDAVINPGTLIRPGQRLGEFIDPAVYEIQIALQKSMISYISVNDTVNLKSLDNTFSVDGVISRINSQVDQQTQTVQVFVETKDERVKEGLYLQAEIYAQTITNAYAVNRSLINNENNVFIVKDTVLDYKAVKPLYYFKEKAVVRGLNDGDILMTSNLSSAYPGMLVKTK